MIQVESAVRCYEVDGAEPKGGEPQVRVRSHWNRNEFVVLETLNGTRVTVSGKDLKAAIDNAQNTGKW